MRNVYLDYSATTPVKDEVLKEMLPYFTEKFGNPSSLYDTGLEAKAAVAHAREQVAALINADPKEVFFTAGGNHHAIALLHKQTGHFLAIARRTARNPYSFFKM